MIIRTNENGICFAIVIKASFFGLRGVFWGKTGSEAIIPVDRLIPSSGRRQVSLSVIFLCKLHSVDSVVVFGEVSILIRYKDGV